MLLGNYALAQQDPMYSQYMFNGLLINPAYAGSHEALSATLLYRNQWVGVSGAPKTGTFTIDAPLNNEKVGLGLNLINDKIGVTTKNGIMGSYSYKIKFNGSILAAGFQVGFNFINSNYTSVQYSDNQSQTDQSFMINGKKQYPGFGLGLYYYTNRFYAGISVPEFGSYFTGTTNYLFNQAVHYFFTTGYVFDISDEMKFKPSTLVKYVNGSPLTADVNLTFWFFDTFTIGTSYRSGASLNIFTEIKLTQQINFGYAYEYMYNDLRNYNTNTHEFMLRYDFNFQPSKVLTPRYF